MTAPRTSSNFDVVVVGSINRDVVLQVPAIPAPGETVLGTSMSTSRGGKGANQAMAAARLGGRVAMIGRVGTDSGGAAYLGALSAAGVDVEGVSTDIDQPTGHATVIVDDAGENAIVVVPGANGRLSSEDVHAMATTLQTAAVTLVQLEVPLDAVTAAAGLCGGGFILNPAPAQPLPEPLLNRVDVLVPNRSELAAITGNAPSDDIVELARQARSVFGPRAIVVTLGAQGALVVDDDSATHVPPHPVNPVDTTGAGDAFCGALATALAADRPLVDAVRWAGVVGALATTKLGAQSGLPTRKEVTAVMETP